MYRYFANTPALVFQVLYESKCEKEMEAKNARLSDNGGKDTGGTAPVSSKLYGHRFHTPNRETEIRAKRGRHESGGVLAPLFIFGGGWANSGERRGVATRGLCMVRSLP